MLAGGFVWKYKEETKVVMTEDGWVNVELHYLGSVKTTDTGSIDHLWSDMPKRTDGDFDVDATMQYQKDKRFVYSYGREIMWLQYQARERTLCGNVYARIGANWDKSLEEYTVYVYEFEYNTEKTGTWQICQWNLSLL